MKFYINGFTIDADNEQEANIIAEAYKKEEDKQIYAMIEERLKNDNGVRYTLEEVREMRRLKHKKSNQ